MLHAAISDASAEPNPMPNLLVVDDDAQLLSTICDGLKAAGFNVTKAENGVRALEALRRSACDLLLTDVWMPGMTGIELLSTLQTQPSPPRTIVMTGDDAPETLLRAIRERAYHYIAKPFKLPQLVELIQQVLEAPPDLPPIEVISARYNWVEVLVPCDLSTAERIHELMKSLKGDLPEETRHSIAQAFREMLMNAVEWGGQLDPQRTVRISYIRGKRMVLYRIADPGPGFRPADLSHAAISNPPEDPAYHMKARTEKGLRPGGFGMLLARAMVDELIYNEAHNEVVLIKYLDAPAQNP